ncbi:MAG: uroporphyrinogen decarboxylase [Anaerolineae bacterium]|nr:uroporphyrinogen decarboxylase [Anaerolineae bacterium]
MSTMTKKERLQAAINGEAVDRPPVALWRHFPGDDYRPEDLAAATIEFQRRYDFDFVKVTPASSFCVHDWGAQDCWTGDPEGTREYTFHPIRSPEDWYTLSILNPTEGALGAQLCCLRLIAKELADEVPFIQTIFNPLAQAKNLVGSETLPVHMRRYPDALHAGLETITRTTIRFIEAARETGIAGIFYAIQHAQYGLLSEEEYSIFGRPYDMRILEAAQGLWLNVLHLHGREVMFDLVADYPVQVINWHDRETWPTLAEALTRTKLALCGGLQRWEVIVRGMPEQVREQAADAIAQTGGRRFILGTGCVVPVVAPFSNIRAAREAVELEV